jgi:hypothetical protein
VYSYDRSDGTLRYISVPLEGAAADANDACGNPALSSDAITAAFVCNASDIVTGDNNGTLDVFARTVTSAPTPNLQAVTATPDVSVAEPAAGSTNATVTVNLDRPAQFDGEIQVSFYDITATAPADYDATTQYVEVAPGDTSGSVEVPIHANGLTSGTRTFGVTTQVDFGDLTPGPHANATVTITAP